MKLFKRKYKKPELDEDKKGLVGKVYGVYVDYSTNLCSGEITFKNKEALDYYIAKAQTEARINELVTLDNENIPALNDSKMFHAYFLKRVQELNKSEVER